MIVLVLPGSHSEKVLDQVTLVAEHLSLVKDQVIMIIKLRWLFMQIFVQMIKPRFENWKFWTGQIPLKFLQQKNLEKVYVQHMSGNVLIQDDNGDTGVSLFTGALVHKIED